jgi:hypothetical protein
VDRLIAELLPRANLLLFAATRDLAESVGRRPRRSPAAPPSFVGVTQDESGGLQPPTEIVAPEPLQQNRQRFVERQLNLLKSHLN